MKQQEFINRCFDKSDLVRCCHPFFLTRKEYLKKYSYNWRTRLMMEFHKRKTYFLTLTFDDAHLPKGSKDEQLQQATDVFQRFIKRLRSKIEYHDFGLNFKYFAVSENGEEMGRLHFHVLLFADGTNTSVLKFRTAVPLFRLIDETWQQGRTQIRVADIHKIYYVTKYLFKRCFDVLYHSWKSNGIGMSYLENRLITFLREHLQTYIHIGGKVRFLPRYILDKVFSGEYEDFRSYVHLDYIDKISIKEESYDMSYYVKDYFGELSPVPDWLGKRIVKMYSDSVELSNLMKYGGYLK